MTFFPSNSLKDVVPFVEAHEKAGAFAPIVNAIVNVEATANMHGWIQEIELRCRRSAADRLRNPAAAPVPLRYADQSDKSKTRRPNLSSLSGSGPVR